MATPTARASDDLHRPLRPADLDRTRRSSAPPPWTQLLGLVLVALSGFSCISAPTPEAWLAAGNNPFRTPEGTFEAFKTATAGEEHDLGYRCLSADFRKQNGISALAFRELADRYPALRYLSRAEVLERHRLSDDEVEYLCRIEVLFKTTRLRIGFIREDFYDVYRGAEPLGGDVTPFAEVARPVASPSGRAGVGMWVPLPSGLPFDEVSEVRVGREWKINSIELEDPSGSPVP